MPDNYEVTMEDEDTEIKRRHWKETKMSVEEIRRLKLERHKKKQELKMAELRIKNNLKRAFENCSSIETFHHYERRSTKASVWRWISRHSTMSVDEWYHQKFGCNPHNAPQSSAPEPQQQLESEEEDDDEARAKAMRWDEV
ncbi:hypothetical protein B9Z55_029101 [Caenorhabditis nigoni]|uniref:Uncharacterized protein n=1 Tax=Caenorhabditis nigoni TaxID=1611254 RepID=A0A2G5S902_9PELO|nr:hypothetical protein B9Z55_029101 [Caenorhabditis nigoni]